MPNQPTYFKGSLKTDDLIVTGTTEQTGAVTFDGLVSVDGGLSVAGANVAATGNDSTQAATIATFAGTVTTGALTTAANAATSVVLTIAGVTAGDVVLCTGAGGTNTTPVYVQSAVATSDTVTVVLRNGVNATTALNGTVAFHYLVIKK